MNTVQVTLSMYYKIVGADLYGGLESRGYAMIVLDFDKKNLESVNLPVLAEEGKGILQALVYIVYSKHINLVNLVIIIQVFKFHRYDTAIYQVCLVYSGK